MESGPEMQYSLHLYPWVGNPQTGGLLLWQKSSPRSKETKPQIGLFSLKVTQKISHQKSTGAYIEESQRAVGNKDSIFKGHTQNYTHPGHRE